MSFTQSQINAINDIKDFINSPVNVHCLSGSPGTGKSFVVQHAIPQIVRNTKYMIQLTATTNKAASVIGGVTLCKLFGIKLKANFDTGVQEYETKYIRNIYNSFIIIDECSMLEKELWSIITQHTYNCKFLLVGDKYQLPAVGSSIDVFSTYPTSELTEVVRQSDPTFLQQIKNAKEGVINKEMYTPINTGPIHILTSKDNDKIRELLKTFTNEDKALSYTNKMSIDLSATIRKLQDKSDDFDVEDPVSPKEYCESITNDGDSVYTGEDLVISNISEVKTITVRGMDIQVREFNFYGHFGTYLVPLDYDYCELIMKKLAKEKAWRDFYFVKERLIDLRFNEASTIHCSQGSTYNRVFIDISDIRKCRAHSTKARLLYVALSRAKNEVYIYDSEL